MMLLRIVLPHVLSPPNSLSGKMSWPENWANFPSYRLSDFIPHDEVALSFATSNHRLLKQEIAFNRKQHGLLKILAAQVRRWLEDGERGDYLLPLQPAAQQSHGAAGTFSAGLSSARGTS